MTSLITRPEIADRWADISPIRKGPTAKISAAIARRIFFKVADRYGITVATAETDNVSGADLVLHRPDEFFTRLGTNGLIGFGDQTMTYSSALFRRLPASWPDLAEAQQHKIDRVLDAAGVGPGTRLLEIGSGWGELCIRP